MLGPIEYLVVAFPGNQFNGKILPELDRLEETGTIRIIDIVFIHKDSNGSVTKIEAADMPEEIANTLADIREHLQGLLAEADINSFADLLDIDSSAGVLVVEHLWAKELKEAIVESGGVLVANGKVEDEDVQLALDDLES